MIATLRCNCCNCSLLPHYGCRRRFSRRFPPHPSLKMQSLIKCLLPFFFMTPAIALSIPSSLSLITPEPANFSPPLSLMNPNSTDLNLSNLTSKSGINCIKSLGQDLNVASCHNAWQKIHGTQQAQRFLPRPSRSHPRDITPEDVVMPFRYLSDDGLCAIVCCPQFTSRLLFFYDPI